MLTTVDFPRNARWPFLFLAILGGFQLGLLAQMPQPDGSTRYGHEWIEPTSPHLRVAVVADDWYKLTAEDLALAGWSLNDANSNRLSLYHQGEEQPIYLAADGLYFYGRRNDGALDRSLYAYPDEDQLNPAFSIFNDTAVYFLRLAPIRDEGQEPSSAHLSNVPNESIQGLTAAMGARRTAQVVFGNAAIKMLQRVNRSSIYYSRYDRCEGYGSRAENDLLSENGTTISMASLELPGFTGGELDFSMRFGLAFDTHQQALRINGQAAGVFSRAPWQVVQLDSSISVSGTSLEVELEGLAGLRDKASLAYIRAEYPSNFSMQGATHWEATLPGSSEEQALVISDFGGSGTVGLFDLNNGYWLSASPDANNQLRFALPAAASLRRLVLHPLGEGTAPANLQTITFQEEAEEDYDYLLVYADPINATGAVDRYAAYRRSPAGGGYRVKVVRMEEAYDRYAYGLRNSPLAIKNMIAHHRSYAPSLNFLFLAGKGREYRDVRTPAQSAAAVGTHFIPPFGYPGTDHLYAASPGSVVSQLAVGRMAVLNGEELDTYLSKLQTMESNMANLPQTVADRAWTKQLLHLGGGTTPSERQSIRRGLENMAGVASDAAFAANVTAYYKSSSDPTETAGLSEIFERINEGTSVITFSGHSSPDVFDFNIDTPENYRNAGRLPAMFSLGCYTGHSYTRNHGVGERFLLMPAHGAITFAATRGQGFISALGIFGERLYTEMSGEQYGKGVGEALRAVYASYENDLSLSGRTLAEQFTLQGDPAYRPQTAPISDLLVDPASVQLENGAVSLQKDSFALRFTINNLGSKPAQDSVAYTIQQVLPGGTIYNHGRYMAALSGFSTPLSLQLANQGVASVGLNRLIIRLDPEDEIPEGPLPAAIANNTLTAGDGRPGIPFFVVSNTAKPLFPYNYALVSPSVEEALTLIAASSNPLAEERGYDIELSEREDFSNRLASTTLTQVGGLLKWQPAVAWRDSTVYYWRVSPDSSTTDGAGYVWQNSSFTYLQQGTSGFGQGDKGQFQDAKLAQLLLLPDGTFVPTADTINLRMQNKVRNTPGQRPGLYFAANIESYEIRPWNYVSAGVAVVVFEGYSALPWPNNGTRVGFNEWGIPNGSADIHFVWRTNDAGLRANLITFLEEVVPDESVVYFFTVIRGMNDTYRGEDWAQDSVALGKNIYSVLEEQGAQLVRQLDTTESVPYILVYRKGVGVIDEVIAELKSDVINSIYPLPGRDPNGSLTSSPIGPAASWEEVRWQVSEMRDASDQTLLELYGGPSPQELSYLQTIPEPGNQALDIDAAAYPYLQFKWVVMDSLSKTPGQLDYCHVVGRFLPDLAFDANSFVLLGADSLQRGETIRLGIAVANPSSVATDSSRVLARWFDGNNNLLGSQAYPLSALAAGDTSRILLEIPTADYASLSSVQLSINPDRNIVEFDYTNNELQRFFRLGQDVVDPLLAVTFDGRRIRDGELVAAKPMILVELRDNNPYLLLDDPESVSIRLRAPSGEERIYTVQDPVVQFIPATSGNENMARFEISPELEEDGRYELLINGRDRTNNMSSALNYEVGFEVVREQQISRVINYPNPFSTYTYFVYELTGTEALMDYRLEIMTIQGEVVRVLGPDELGPLEVGRHQTANGWDGTDRFGDRLANGVYLYRFVTRSENGEAVKDRATSLDAFFTNNMGKMVLLR